MTLTLDGDPGLGERGSRHVERLTHVLALVLLAHGLNYKGPVVGHGEATVVLPREHEDLPRVLVPEDVGRRVAVHRAAQRHGAPDAHHLVRRRHEELGVRVDGETRRRLHVPHVVLRATDVRAFVVNLRWKSHCEVLHRPRP